MQAGQPADTAPTTQSEAELARLAAGRTGPGHFDSMTMPKMVNNVILQDLLRHDQSDLDNSLSDSSPTSLEVQPWPARTCVMISCSFRTSPKSLTCHLAPVRCSPSRWSPRAQLLQCTTSKTSSRLYSTLTSTGSFKPLEARSSTLKLMPRSRLFPC